MRIVSIADMPLPPIGKVGWPWMVLPGESPGPSTETLIQSRIDAFIWPRITLVTPSYNQGDFIEETIRSVLLQGYPNLEYFIMDGGSQDATVEIIRKYESWITGWVSKSDGGQSDAIAKGFDKTTGVRLGWINSDDLLMPGALLSVAVLHQSTPHALIVGNVINRHMHSGKEEIIRQRNITLEALLRLWERSMLYHQPGIFIPRDAYQKAGGIDRSLIYTMDYDLLCRLLCNNVPVVYTDRVLAIFRLHASSKTMAENTNMALEAYQVASRYWYLLGESHRYYAFRMLIHLMLRAAKWMIRGEWGVALHSLKGGIRLFIREVRRPKFSAP